MIVLRFSLKSSDGKVTHDDVPQSREQRMLPLSNNM